MRVCTIQTFICCASRNNRTMWSYYIRTKLYVLVQHVTYLLQNVLSRRFKHTKSDFNNAICTENSWYFSEIKCITINCTPITHFDKIYRTIFFLATINPAHCNKITRDLRFLIPIDELLVCWLLKIQVICQNVKATTNKWRHKHRYNYCCTVLTARTKSRFAVKGLHAAIKGILYSSFLVKVVKKT